MPVCCVGQVSEESRQLSELVSEVESQLPADTAVTIPGQLPDLQQLLTKLSARLLEGQAGHERLTKHGQWRGRRSAPGALGCPAVRGLRLPATGGAAGVSPTDSYCHLFRMDYRQ